MRKLITVLLLISLTLSGAVLGYFVGYNVGFNEDHLCPTCEEYSIDNLIEEEKEHTHLAPLQDPNALYRQYELIKDYDDGDVTFNKGSICELIRRYYVSKYATSWSNPSDVNFPDGGYHEVIWCPQIQKTFYFKNQDIINEYFKPIIK